MGDDEVLDLDDETFPTDMKESEEGGASSDDAGDYHTELIEEQQNEVKTKKKRRGIFGRIFKRGKLKEARNNDPDSMDVVTSDTTTVNLTGVVVEEVPTPLSSKLTTKAAMEWLETYIGKVPVSFESLVGTTETGATRTSSSIVPRAPLMSKDQPIATVAASIPLALVLWILIVRVAWYFFQRHQKKKSSVEEAAGDTTPEPSLATISKDGTNDNTTTTTNSSNGAANGHAAQGEVDGMMKKAPPTPVDEEAEKELQKTLEREAIERQSLATENQALQQALDMHKSSVDKFSAELQVRNERLSVFEKEQDTVRRELSSQIEVLKQELQERQKQEQGNLKNKESLCNDLITKIKALNKDLENHEKLWQGVAQKAEKKEVESAAKVDTLQKSLKEEEEQRLVAVKAKEDACANLTTKLQALQAQRAKQVKQTAALDKHMGAGVFPAAEEKLRSRLKEEQDHASSLTTKMQVFSAELQSREERVSTLDAKMKEVERLSASELKELQRELEGQVIQRKKLQEAAVEMTRLLQEKQNQCARLQTQWESSTKELKVLNEKVQTLTKEVNKREATALERINGLQAQLDQERSQKQALQETSEKTNDELIKKQEEFVQLTTRMDLFLKELQFRDTQVASLESKLTEKEDLATSEIKDLKGQLEEATTRRDTWTKTTDDLTQLLKDKKAQVVGLTTRADLFERELQNRQEGVDALESKIKDIQEAEAIKMEPYRKELQRLQQERDSWKEKTEAIGRTLKERVAQTAGMMTRLKLFRDQLSTKDERVSLLRTKYEDKKHSAYLDVAPIREKLTQQREQRDAWMTRSQDIDRTLQEKRAQCVGMKTRVHLFGRELESKEKLVADFEAVVNEKEEAGDSIIATLSAKVADLVKGRDEWRASTTNVIRLQSDRMKEAAGLTSELKGLVTDLQNYQQRRAKLEAEAEEQKTLFAGRHEALEENLRVAQEYHEKWVDKTKDVTQALKGTEQSIVGLETREMLFEKELEQRTVVVQKLQKEYWAMEKKNSMKMEQLRGAIKAEQNLHEHGVEKTVKLHKELKYAKRECVGLTTRSELFTRELQKRKNALAEHQKKILNAEGEASALVEGIRRTFSEHVNARDEWKKKTEEVDRLQLQNDQAIVGLATRLEVFMVQVMKEEDNVARADRKLNMLFGRSSDSNLLRELDAAKDKRDEWTAKALDIEKELKTRRAQVAGLKTRKMLFRVELDKLEEQVSTWKVKLQQKERITRENMTPLRHTLKQLQQQQDDWTSKLDGINKMLDAKQRECLPISKRLEEVIDQLTQGTERTEDLQRQLIFEESFREDKVKALKSKLEDQKKELSQWKNSTFGVKKLLEEKRQGTEGLKTRLNVFNAELQKRLEFVDGVKTLMEENNNALTQELDLIEAQIEAEQLERDRIIETTLSKNQELKAMESTCTAMTVRRRLFEDELHTREEQATLLEAKLKEKEYDHSAEMKRLKTELAARTADRDKWRDSTQSIKDLLQATERECVGLATRSQLFKVEKEKYEQQVSDLEDTVTRKEADSAEKIGPLHSQLQQEQQDRDSWDKKTVELDSMLQEHKREIVGLKTRSKLFVVELKNKDKNVAALSTKVKEEDEDFAKRMNPLVQESTTLKAERDKWVESTAKVKAMLEKTKTEVASIPTRLDLFRREQETRATAVAELEASIGNKEDLVAVQLGFLLNEMQLQQKQRGKWKKVTLDMHRLLKETKEQVSALTSKLESCNSEIESHEQRILSMDATLRDARDMTEQQLDTLKGEVERQSTQRDKLRLSTAELNRLLEETKEQCTDLTKKLAAAEKEVQSSTATVESLKTKVTEKKALDTSQIESIKAQLKVHLGQRAEWRENTNLMKKRLKEKQLLCTSLKTKLTLLQSMQSGDVRSSLSTDEPAAPDVPLSSAADGIAAHLEKINQMTSNLGKKTQAEEKLTTRMDVLEHELRKQKEEEKKLVNSTQQLEQGLKEKESQCADLAGQLTSITKQYGTGAGVPLLDVDRMLAEKEKTQSKLNSKLESLAGALLSL